MVIWLLFAISKTSITTFLFINCDVENDYCIHFTVLPFTNAIFPQFRLNSAFKASKYEKFK